MSYDNNNIFAKILRGEIPNSTVLETEHTLAHVEGSKVTLDYRPVPLDPLTTEDEGGIEMKKIAPKARVY